MAANYDAILFTWDSKASPLLLGFWRDRTPEQSLQATVELIDPEGYATDTFRRAWIHAFPHRDPLPEEPVAGRAGRGTEAFWTVFA